MGSLCCCFHAEEPEENDDTSRSRRKPFSFSNCFGTLFNKYTAVIDKEDAVIPAAEPANAVVLAADNTRSVATTTANVNAVVPAANNTEHVATTTANATAPPQNISFEAHPMSSAEGQLQHKDLEEQLTSKTGPIADIISNENDSSTHSIEKMGSDFCYIYASLDDEDVCSICLEEYTFEEPRIITECKHHYHLPCIYEWKEISQTCPICQVVMVRI